MTLRLAAVTTLATFAAIPAFAQTITTYACEGASVVAEDVTPGDMAAWREGVYLSGAAPSPAHGALIGPSGQAMWATAEDAAAICADPQIVTLAGCGLYGGWGPNSYFWADPALAAWGVFAGTPRPPDGSLGYVPRGGDVEWTTNTADELAARCEGDLARMIDVTYYYCSADGEVRETALRNTPEQLQADWGLDAEPGPGQSIYNDHADGARLSVLDAAETAVMCGDAGDGTVPADGLWRVELTGAEMEGCPAEAEASVAQMMGTAQELRIDWPEPFTPAPIFDTSAAPGAGPWVADGDTWTVAVMRQEVEGRLVATFDYTVTVVSEDRLDLRGDFAMSMLGRCESTSTATATRIGD